MGSLYLEVIVQDEEIQNGAIQSKECMLDRSFQEPEHLGTQNTRDLEYCRKLMHGMPPISDDVLKLLKTH